MALAGFNNSFKLTIDSSKVDEDLTDFPVNITLSSGTGQTGFDVSTIFDELGSDANRKKIAVTDSNYNQLYVEIERWDHPSEEANLWVKVPTITSGTDTDLYLYYDVTATTNSGYVGDTGDSPAQQVWESNFKGVWHMAQDPTGGSDCILDSTSQGGHGTPGGTWTTGDLIDGVVGKGLDFDQPTSDYITLNSTGLSTLTVPYTLEFSAVRPQPWTGNAGIFMSIVPAAGDLAVGISANDINIGTSSSQLGVTPVGSYINETDYFSYTVIYNSASDQELYLNGVKQTVSAVGDYWATSGYVLGARGAGSYSMNGKMDEIRASTIKRSNSWIKATYYSTWDDLITFNIAELFIFSNPIPIHLSTVYGLAHQLQLTVSGADLTYDAGFYDASDDSQIGSTISGTQSGQYVSTTMSTPLGTDYNWYVTATASGGTQDSDTYTFTNRFLCSGYTQVAGTGVSGIPVRLYRRITGAYIGGAISSGVSGTFDIPTDYNEYHYAVALYPTDDTNALIADWIKPDN